MSETDTNSRDNHLPSATLEVLQLRSRLLAVTRDFFDSHGYMEVETPILSHDTVIDSHLEPFTTQLASTVASSNTPAELQSQSELFLQTSPEFGMKRLLAAGAQAIYQITRAFRQAEFGRYHNPEFTIIEWYRVGDTHHQQMDFVEQYITAIFQKVGMQCQPDNTSMTATNTNPSESLQQPFQRLSYDEAFIRHVGTKVLHLNVTELAELASQKGIVVPKSFGTNRDSWLNLLLAELVEPHLGFEEPVFVYDYPASQAALACIRDEKGHPSVAERFELYIRGIEICNGYHELTDPVEFRRRIDQQSTMRKQEGYRRLPEKNRLLRAMETDGLPPCAGVALGFDRLVMLAAGATSLAKVIAFPIDRA